jgi:hypothetical protein
LRAQRERNADHAFAADHADFQGHVVVHHRQQRNQRIAGKVDMPDLLPGLVEHVAELQLDPLQTGTQAPVVLAGQRSKQAVGNFSVRCVHSHGEQGWGEQPGASVRQGTQAHACHVR